MSPIPSHPLAILIVILVLAIALAGLAPHSGALGLAKNIAIAVLGLCTLMLFGASIGKIVGDFIREMNGSL